MTDLQVKYQEMRERKLDNQFKRAQDKRRLANENKLAKTRAFLETMQGVKNATGTIRDITGSMVDSTTSAKNTVSTLGSAMKIASMLG